MKPTKRLSRHPKDYSPTEHAEQVAFIQWFDITYPHYFLFAIPNGEKRAIHAAVRLKREGVRSGVPDLCLAYPAGGDAALFIEMKRKGGGSKSKGKISAIQSERHIQLENAGYKVVVCYGCDEAMQAVKEYLGE